MRQFQAAMALTGEEFSEAVQYYSKVRAVCAACAGAGQGGGGCRSGGQGVPGRIEGCSCGGQAP